jgi:hypothetical protein
MKSAAQQLHKQLCQSTYISNGSGNTLYSAAFLYQSMHYALHNITIEKFILVNKIFCTLLPVPYLKKMGMQLVHIV